MNEKLEEIYAVIDKAAYVHMYIGLNKIKENVYICDNEKFKAMFEIMKTKNKFRKFTRRVATFANKEKTTVSEYDKYTRITKNNIYTMDDCLIIVRHVNKIDKEEFPLLSKHDRETVEYVTEFNIGQIDVEFVTYKNNQLDAANAANGVNEVCNVIIKLVATDKSKDELTKLLKLISEK